MSTPLVIDTATRSADVPTEKITLVGEHAVLLRAVQRRAAPVLALVAARSWPEAELRALTGFLHSTLLRQASDEEVSLYPSSAAASFIDLRADHVALLALTRQLDQAEAASCDVAQLGQLVHQTLALLERHLTAEQAALTQMPDAPADVPSTAGLIAGTQHWLPADGEPVLILLDLLPPEQCAQLCIERLLRLHPGQVAEVRSSRESDLRRVSQWMHGFDSSRYGLARPSTGITPVPLRVTRRQGP